MRPYAHRSTAVTALLVMGLFVTTSVHASCSNSRGGWRVTSSDRWSGTDKLEHFVVSAGLGAIGAYLARDTEHPVLYGAGLGLIPGLAKEVFDGTCRAGGFSYKDLTADALGALTGAALGHWAITYTRERSGGAVVGLTYNNAF